MEPWVYVVLLGIAVMVFAILQQNRNADKGGASVADFEEALDRFVDVVEEDNRELLETVSGWRRELEAEIHRLEGRLDVLEKQLARPAGADAPPAETAGSAAVTGGGMTPVQGNAAGRAPYGPVVSGMNGNVKETALSNGPDEANEAFIPPVAVRAPQQAISAPGKPDAGPEKAEKVPKSDLRSRYPQLFEWYDAGKSLDYIAKKSGMNKGEVMLILQLAKREEQNRV